jgi:creatinine amidohydrolase
VTSLLTTATATDEREHDAQVAVLPIGSFEQHGSYLPLITDTAVACIVAQQLAEAYPLMVLPPVTISCSHEHAAWRGTVSISSQTLHRIVLDIAESLRQSGVQRLVLVNGHGGNYVLSNIVQEYTAAHGPVMALFPQGAEWDQARTDAGMVTGGHADMHAGELETSILLHAAPELVRPGNDGADWQADDRPHLLTVGMRGYTTSGVIGSPSLGTADKGRACLASLVGSFKPHYELIVDGVYDA